MICNRHRLALFRTAAGAESFYGSAQPCWEAPRFYHSAWVSYREIAGFWSAKLGRSVLLHNGHWHELGPLNHTHDSYPHKDFPQHDPADQGPAW